MTPKPVHTVRVAIAAGLLVAICVAILYRVREVPDRVVSLLGGPAGGVDRWGGLRVRYTPPPGTEAAVEDYLAGRANVDRHGNTLAIELEGVAEDTADELIAVLTGGGLTMHEAFEDDWAVQIAADNPLVAREEDLDAEQPPTDLARLVQDYWHADDGSVHRTHYLIAPTQQALDRAIAAAKARGVELGDDREIRYELIEPRTDARVPRVEWRAYALATRPAIDGTMIASAMGSFEPNTGRAIVLLDFTSEGASVFCELTAEITGKKLATVLGGQVRSAPIINGPICGGHASITMGGTDPEYQLRERDMLVEVLRHGGLPSGGTIEDRRWTPPADTRALEHLGRMLLGFLAGLVTSLIVFAVVRFARPVVSSSPPRTGELPWRRLLVTATAPLALLVGRHVTLPGVDEVEFEHLTRGADGAGASVLALGLTPIVVAFVLVELVALAVPALRWRRHDPAGRIRLGQAVAILAIVLALVQAYFASTNLEYGSPYGGVVDFPGWRFRMLTMISLTAGTLLLAIVAGAITEHGLGNGYGVIAATGIAFEIVPDLQFEDPFTASYALELVVFAALVIAALHVLRWRVVHAREPALRLPLTGLSPLADTGAFLMLAITMTGFSFGFELYRVLDWAYTLSEPQIKLGLVALSIPVWAWLFARPRVIERVALQAGLDRPRRETWLRALAISGLLVLGASLLVTFVRMSASGPLIDAVSAFVLAAVVLDVVADWRARRGTLALVGVIHQPQYLGVVERVLDEANIPYHVHAVHLRALLAFFGPWVPIRILVPDEHAMVARLELDKVLQPARGTVPEARAV